MDVSLLCKFFLVKAVENKDKNKEKVGKGEKVARYVINKAVPSGRFKVIVNG